MRKEKDQEREDASFPSPKGMSEWLESEIANIQRAATLRMQDAARFVNAYARGEITREEAENHSYAYSQRWGDVLPGVMSAEGLSDDEILQCLDQTRIKQGLLNRHVSIGRKGGASGPSR